MITRKLRSILGLALALLTMIAGPGLPLGGQAFALAPANSVPANGPAAPSPDIALASPAAPNPATPAAGATDPNPILADDFSTCSLGTFEDSTGLATCENGEYAITVKQANYSWWVAYSDQIGDAIIEVDARSVSTDPFSPYGLIWRTGSGENSFYVFVIGSGQRYGVFLYDRPNFTTLVPYTFSPAINPDTATNHLKVIAQGDQAAVYVNGQWLNTITDSTFATGEVGFYAETNGAGGKAAFDNLLVSAIDAPLDLPAAAPAPAGTPILSDDFNDPNACALGTYDDSTGSLTCQNGKYIITIKQAYYAQWVTYSHLFTDAIIEVDARSISATPFASYGLIWRSSSSLNSFYLFLIDSGGTYDILRYDQGSFITLVPDTPSAAISSDTGTNRLKVVVQGDQMAVYVNDQWLNTITDSTLTEGTIGLYAQATDANAVASFDNFSVSNIDQPISLPVPAPAGASDATPVLQDNFATCTLPTVDDQDHTLGCQDGQYVMLSKVPETRWVYYGEDYGDTVIQVDTRIISSTSTAFVEYGLVFRVAGDGNNYYAFTVTNDGEYSFFYLQNDNWTDVVSYTPSSAVLTDGSWNHLDVYAQGDQFTFFVNGQMLTTVSDATFDSGTVGFVLNTDEGGSEVAFSNLRVWQLNSPYTPPRGAPAP
jgi:hypothetical protein